MHAGVVDVAAAARRGLRWLLRGRRVHDGQGCGCGCELMIEGWWCETRGALSARVSQWCGRAQELSWWWCCAVLAAPAGRDDVCFGKEASQLEGRAQAGCAHGLLSDCATSFASSC